VRLSAPPGSSPNPPSKGGPRLSAGRVGGWEGEKEGFRGGRCRALYASAAAFFLLLELPQAHPSPPSSPYPAPSFPRLIVILLGAFIEKYF
jgi:hypothetical protein